MAACYIRQNHEAALLNSDTSDAAIQKFENNTYRKQMLTEFKIVSDDEFKHIIGKVKPPKKGLL